MLKFPAKSESKVLFLGGKQGNCWKISTGWKVNEWSSIPPTFKTEFTVFKKQHYFFMEVVGPDKSKAFGHWCLKLGRDCVRTRGDFCHLPL